jgi:hypothetical protein
MKPFYSLVGLAFSLLVQSVSAETSTRMKFRINVTTPEFAKSIVLEGSTGEREIERDGHGIGNVEAREMAWETSNIAVLWNDDTSTSFPVHISVIFAGLPNPIDLHFRRDETLTEVAPGATLRCVESAQSIVRELFQMLRECRRLTKKIEEIDNPYTLLHRRALQGWLEASSLLYRKMSPMVGPYGVDRGLLDRVREVVRLVDVKHYSEESFRPLVVATARDLISLVDDEDIRLADYVTKLTDQRRWEDAKLLNDFVSARFAEVSRARGVSIIRGVNTKVLQDNDKFIELKLRQVDSKKE